MIRQVLFLVYVIGVLLFAGFARALETGSALETAREGWSIVEIGAPFLICSLLVK